MQGVTGLVIRSYCLICVLVIQVICSLLQKVKIYVEYDPVFILKHIYAILGLNSRSLL